MHKGFLSNQSRTFNAVMSSICILVENTFAATLNVFNFLAFHAHFKHGGRNIDNIYMVANFLMNARPCYYGNQMTAATALALAAPPTIHELIARSQ